MNANFFCSSSPVNASVARDGSSVAGVRTGTKTRLLPWDIYVRQQGWSAYRYLQTIDAVSARAALYQWRKGNALPLGGRVRVYPALTLF